MAMKGHSTFPRSPELVPHPQMQFSVILKTTPLLFRWEVLTLCKGYSQCILISADRVNWQLTLATNTDDHTLNTKSLDRLSLIWFYGISTNIHECLFFFFFFFPQLVVQVWQNFFVLDLTPAVNLIVFSDNSQIRIWKLWKQCSFVGRIANISFIV